MSRDMQIGLGLAVGFLALVGGVLYYRIEHPEDLEQFLGSTPQALATSPAEKDLDTSKPDQAPGSTPSQNTLTQTAANGGTPPAPSLANAPPLEVPASTIGALSASTGTIIASMVPTVVQTGSAGSGAGTTGAGTTGTGSTANNTLPTPPFGGSTGGGTAGTIDFSAMEKAQAKKAQEQKDSEARAALAKLEAEKKLREQAAMNVPSPPAGVPPTISLDLTKTTPAASTDNKPVQDEKTRQQKPPVDLTIKTDVPGTNPMPPLFPPAVNTNQPTPPGLNAGGGLPTPPKTELGKTELGKDGNPPSITTSDPNKTDNNKGTPNLNKNSDEMPVPPGLPPALVTSNTGKDNTASPLNNTNPAPPLGFNNTPPNFNTNNHPTNTPTPPGNANPPDFGKPPLDVTIRPDPASIKPSSDRPTETDPNGFRSYTPPKAGLGKPMPESEVALRERRWADSVGNPAPIIPSSMESRGSVSTAPNTGPGVRNVLRDTTMPRERALPGETFSSLSQRLYGDTSYAVALAAFNQEEGFVKMDQPTAGEYVAKPNREILDQKYPQLVRRLTPTTLNPGNMAQLTNNAQANPPKTAVPAANTNYPTYRVAKGDQLFEVAKKTLGDGYRWSEIYALNKELLRESTELRPDMVLKLPMEARK